MRGRRAQGAVGTASSRKSLKGQTSLNWKAESSPFGSEGMVFESGLKPSAMVEVDGGPSRKTVESETPRPRRCHPIMIISISVTFPLELGNCWCFLSFGGFACIRDLIREEGENCVYSPDVYYGFLWRVALTCPNHIAASLQVHKMAHLNGSTYSAADLPHRSFLQRP